MTTGRVTRRRRSARARTPAHAYRPVYRVSGIHRAYTRRTGHAMCTDNSLEPESAFTLERGSAISFHGDPGNLEKIFGGPEKT